ncbi:MAG: glucosaminidase domain-containing protein [Bacillota bacterium]
MFLKQIKYLLAVSLVLLIVFGWQYQIAFEKEKSKQLEKQFNDLNQIYTDTVNDLDEVRDENETLFLQLHDALIKIDDVEKRNAELELILFNQRQTYRHAVAMQGSIMPVLTQSSFTAQMYERAWVRLGAHGLKGIGDALVEAEERYGVNSLVLASIAYLESAGGMSKIARNKNNLFGLGAGDIDPYGHAMSFSYKDDSIYYVANLFRTNYLSRGGRFYRGENLEAIGIRYASDPLWAYKVGRAMSIIARSAIPEGR